MLFEEDEAEAAAARELLVTHLTAWFALNAEAAQNDEETPREGRLLCGCRCARD